MSHPTAHDAYDGPTLKIRPRGRTFELPSEPPSVPATPSSEAQTFNLNPPKGLTDGMTTPSRTRSILNLTSSTLLGIYQPTGYATEREEPSTPWGTGAETPVESRSASFGITRSRFPGTGPNGYSRRRRSTLAPAHVRHRPSRGFKAYWLPFVSRILALGAVGVLYGLLISHLHDERELPPVKLENLNSDSWAYLFFWAAAGVVLGETLPWVDKTWAPQDNDDIEEPEEEEEWRSSSGPGYWADIVRFIGAFVGITFAIRKLPWQSTLQLSMTFALANAAVWYLIDRSPAGLLLAAVAALSSTAVLVGVNPALVPLPTSAQLQQSHIGMPTGGANGTANIGSEDLMLGMFSHDSVVVVVWFGSVLFVSSVCFGNIGRQLAPRTA
ncbi:hypothetical protein LTR08_006726 [Meristemomyces frigidus]|nr:hypothetical protein LTR08_006726 [Meristemomyces frigidus]